MSRHTMDQAMRRRPDDGFTITELLIVVMLLGLVSILLLTTLESITRTSARTEAKAQTLADTRTALETIARDLRAANPVNAITAGTTSVYDNTIAFDVYCSSGPGCVNNLRPVKYSVTGNTLYRTVGGTTGKLLGPSGTPTLATTLRRGAILNPITFSYFRDDGTQIDTSTTAGVGEPATYFRDCTKRVKIALRVRSNANDATQAIELATAVTLRNYNEVNPC